MIDRECLPADVGRMRVRGKMHAVVQRVGGHRQPVAGGNRQERGVVADAQRHVVAGGDAAADAIDQGEFHGGAP